MADQIPIPDTSQLPDQSAPNQYALQNANQAMTPQAQAPPTEQPYVQDQSGATLAMGGSGTPDVGQPPVTGTKDGIKSLLTGIFGQHGMGGYLMNSFGLPTPDQRQQKQVLQAQKQQMDQSTIQYHQALAKNLADQNELVPVQQPPLPDGTPQEPIYIARRSQAQVVNKQAQLQQQAQIQALNSQLKARGIGGQIAPNPTTGQMEFQPLAQSQLTIPQQATIQQKQQGGAPSEARLTLQSLRGDPEAKAALAEIQGRRMDLVKARGSMMNQRPLYMLQRTIENGIPQFMTGYQILQAQQEGRQIQPAGALSAKDVLTVQRLQSESKPAIEGVKSTLGTYDNASDRAIYARVLSAAGTPGVGEESSWMGNIINQAATSGLSTAGQKQAVALRRLADTMGTMRSLMGLQATDQAMALTLSLLPGPNTPSSSYAKDQVNQLEGMLKAAIQLPALGAAKTPEAGGGGGAKPTHRFNPKTNKIEAIP